MWILTIRFLSWLGRTVVPMLAVFLLVIAGLAVFLFVRDRVDLEADRTRQLQALAVEEASLLEAREEARVRWESLREEFEAVGDKYRRAERLMANLEALSGFWKNLFRTKEERERERERMLWAEQKKKEFGWELSDLRAREEAARTYLEHLEERLAAVALDRQALETAESEVVGYVQSAWLMARQPLAVGLAAFFFGPTVWKVFCFYFWAPLLGLGRPVRLREISIGELRTAGSQVSRAVSLAPGERAVAKEKFLQASDEELRRRTRFVFDWRIPFSCVACGLIELVEMVNATTTQRFSITFSTQEDPTMELSEIELAEGESLVLRPSHLAAVVLSGKDRLRIDRHWRIFSVHAWVTLQFRYFEFHGPCRLIVGGKRGVRAEQMRAAGEVSLSRRTNQDSTIGFTPNLEYRSVRAETFWAYYRGKNPLFDDVFRGSAGAFLCQEISSRGARAGARRFWSSFWGGLMKVFGL